MTEGNTGTYFTKDEAYTAACDAVGVDPTLPLPERLARLRDINQGSGLMYEERMRKENYEQRLKAKFGQ